MNITLSLNDILWLVILFMIADFIVFLLILLVKYVKNNPDKAFAIISGPLVIICVLCIAFSQSDEASSFLDNMMQETLEKAQEALEVSTDVAEK